MTTSLRTLALAALVPTVASAATPVLSGLYAVGEVGLVEFTTIDGKVSGRLKLSAECSLETDATVVSGVFEGTVLIASVNLCQEGASCPAERTYPMLGVWLDDTVAGRVRLDPGCTSPALDGKALHIRPASVEEKQRVLGDTGSAAQTAQRQNRGDPVAQAAEAVLRGMDLLDQGSTSKARAAFEDAVALSPSWQAYYGLGVAETHLKRGRQALDALDKALELGPRDPKVKAKPTELRNIHYARACALASLSETKSAVAALRTAIKVGGAVGLAELLKSDPDLNAIRGDAEFKRLYTDIVSAQGPRKRGR